MWTTAGRPQYRWHPPVTCAVGSLLAGSGGGATITTEVAHSTTGALQDVAQISDGSGTRVDPNLANNTSVAITQASKK